MSRSADQVSLFCDRCAAAVHPGRADFYVVRIDAFADPTPPEFTDEDLQRDHRREIESLIGRLHNLSEQELMDQVYRRVSLILCNRCYAAWIEKPLSDGSAPSPIE
jgi:hypothetical protein